METNTHLDENGVDLSNAILLITDGFGIYIPKMFAIAYEGKLPDEDTLNILRAGPDSEDYWDAWEDVLNVVKVDFDGKMYDLYQAGDLWAVPCDNENN
jgi:hypothetical protein